MSEKKLEIIHTSLDKTTESELFHENFKPIITQHFGFTEFQIVKNIAYKINFLQSNGILFICKRFLKEYFLQQDSLAIMRKTPVSYVIIAEVESMDLKANIMRYFIVEGKALRQYFDTHWNELRYEKRFSVKSSKPFGVYFFPVKVISELAIYRG